MQRPLKMVEPQSDINNALTDSFVLDMPAQDNIRQVTIGWLLLSLGALVIGGLFSILIVFSRTPFFQDIIPWVDFFHTALVVHVDMTVLVWFLGFAGFIWSLNVSQHGVRNSWVALAFCIVGTLVISIAPFMGIANPLMNNYVPVLQHPVFYAGLGIFGLGFSMLVLNGLLFSHSIGMTISGDGALRFGLYTALIAALVSIIIFMVSWSDIPVVASGAYYFELLFWDAGHTLQFVHVQLMLVAWLWTATVSGIGVRLSPRIALFIFTMGLAPVLLTPVAYIVHDLGTTAHKEAISQLMQYGGGLAAVPIGLMIFHGFIFSDRRNLRPGPEFYALITSMLLFGIGGVIGFMIHGSNVTVPAHYHGSIVAVTLAYMGLTYHLLPRLGFDASLGKLATWQPVIYAIGQLMHVFGLVWSGGYGVQRKTAGSDQALDNLERMISMGVMGLGGLIAVIGGILFLYIVFRVMWLSRSANK